eukprot:CAMPEP_0172315352 /NCGR_PEP_ID=MMETSP1058-20130122/24938_1 /TAXON_ID=83371 /ORGANISM="Detonula confervacea, Strain CCMP 353" /LENGTH=341 /DNA_ID=CAMNT_0013029419 /DNA_START=240 /DNA_END=1262 /DNA_ORIENTATION=+
MAPHHICTNCTRPTATLYKVYSTPGSIQLTTCKRCGPDVDPYIEREWLLVIMDCVLHRPEAFRHVLYNREPFCDFSSSGRSRMVVKDDDTGRKKNKDNSEDASTIIGSITCGGRWGDSISFRRLIRYSFMASLLRCYLWYVAKGAGREGRDLAPELIISLAQSIMGELVLVMTTIIAGSFCVKRATTPQTNDESPTLKNMNISSQAFFYSRLHLALTIPVFFHIATMFALIWENSSTVCLLGTLFVLSLQYMGVSVVLEEQMGRAKDSLGRDTTDTHDQVVSSNEKSVWMCFRHSAPFIVGLIVRTLVAHITRHVLVSVIPVDVNTLVCTGISLPQSIIFG